MTRSVLSSTRRLLSCSKKSLQFVFSQQRCASTSNAAVPLHFLDLAKKDNSASDVPILVTHGMLGSIVNWTSICKRLNAETKRRVVAIDARNHGKSTHCEEMSYELMRGDVVHFVRDTLGVDKATLLGHSMGGRTFMWTALNNPEVVENLIVVDISPINYPMMSHKEILEAMMALKFLQNVPASEARKDADAQLAKAVKDPGLRAWLLMNMAEQGGKIGWGINVEGIYNSYIKGVSKFPVGYKQTFSGRTLFIGGDKSSFIPKDSHDEVRKTFPNAEFEYVKGAGHWVHSEKPNEFLEIVLKFLSS